MALSNLVKKYRSKKITPYNISESAQVQEVKDNILKQQEVLREYDVGERKKEKAGALQRLFHLLRPLEPAPYIMAHKKGENLLNVFTRQIERAWNTGIRGLKPEYETEVEREIDTALFSDVFEEYGWKAETTQAKIARAVGGLGLDILLDPKTYLTFGALKAGKVFHPTKGLLKLNKTGKKLLKKRMKQFGPEAGAKMVATQAAKKSKKYLAKEGLKFMGMELLPRKVVQAPFKFMNEIVEKTPLIGNAYKGFKSWGKKAFTPWKTIEKIPEGVGTKYRKTFEQWGRGTRDLQQKAIQRISGAAAKSRKALGDDIGLKLPEYIEKGGKVFKKGNEPLNDLVKWYSRQTRRQLDEGQKLFNIGEIEGYVKHAITPKGEEFLQKTGKWNTIIKSFKNASTKGPEARKSRKILKTIKEVNKELASEMERVGIKLKKGEGFFEPNAFKTLAKGETELIQAKQTFKFYDEISERFGYKVSRLSKDRYEALKLSEKMGKRTLNFDGVKYIEPDIAKPVGWKRNPFENVLLPEPIVDHLKSVHALITGAEEPAQAFLKVYDKVLRFWKGSVTGWFPAFHSRNMIGATWNNFLFGVKSPRWYKKTRDIMSYRASKKGGKKVATKHVKLGGVKYSYDDVIRMAEKEGVFGLSGPADVVKEIDDMISNIEKTKGLKFMKKALKNPRGIEPHPLVLPSWMEAIENRVRLPLFLHRLNQGDDAYNAARMVFRAHFDYFPKTGYSQFERNVMRRIIPFYTWTRNNVPLQFEMLARQPGKYAGLDKLRREIESITGTDVVREERKHMPKWMSEMFTIRTPFVKSSGEPYYLQLDLPVEDLNKLSVREITSLLSPVLKYPIERIANKYIFFDSPIYDKDLPREYQVANTTEIIKHLPKPVKDFLNIQELKQKNYYTGEFEDRVVMDARALHFIRSLFLSRVYSTLTGLTEGEKDPEEKLTRFVLGEPLRPLDISREKWSRLKQHDVELRDLLYFMKQSRVVPYSSESELEFLQEKVSPPKGSLLRRIGQFFIK